MVFGGALQFAPPQPIPHSGTVCASLWNAPVGQTPPSILPSLMNWKNFYFLLVAAAMFVGVDSATAQSYAMTARSFVQSPVALGMGDAGVAFSTKETAFFYNPAHVARAAGAVPSFTFLGVNARVSDGVLDYYDFYSEDLEPALDEGIENMDGQERQDLYDRAFEIGRQREYANVDVVLPSVLFRVGPVGVGAGVFNYTGTQVQISDAGGGVPNINLNAQLDVIGMATAGMNFGGVSVGAAAKYTQRYLTLKSKPLDAFGEEEAFNLYSGNSIGIDLGALYTLDVLPLPGDLTVGAALFDVAGTKFDYAFERSITDDERNEATESQEIALADELRQVSPSYRVGVGYQVPSLFGVFGQTGVALDYLGYSEPFIEDQPFLAQIHLGAQVQLVKVLAVRAGLSQGYPTAGAGLRLGPVRLDYSYFGQEEGRLPGQNASWHHHVRLAFGLF